MLQMAHVASDAITWLGFSMNKKTDTIKVGFKENAEIPLSSTNILLSVNKAYSICLTSVDVIASCKQLKKSSCKSSSVIF